MDSFDKICVSLASLYGLLALISFIQLIRLVSKEKEALQLDDFKSTLQLFLPNTIQHQMHILVFLLCFIRTIFFIIALFAWNQQEGEVVNDKLAFYSLDEFASVLFFTITSILGLFWAELYYISTQQGHIFTKYIKPLVYSLNVFAFIGIILCIIYVRDIDYIYVQYTILIASLYLISALMFLYYANVAAAELKNIPVILSARRDRLRLLWSIAIICVVSLVVKSIIIIYVTGKAITINSNAMLGVMFIYYFLFELTPLCIVLIFYRVESPTMSRGNSTNRLVGNDTKDPEDYDEYSALAPSNTYNRTFNQNIESSEVVDSVIARLSLDV